MARQETDFPVAELTKRYELVKSQVYARINALKSINPDLAPFKIGVKSYVNAAVLGCLDEMHRLISEEELTTEQAAEQIAGVTETSIIPNNQQTLSTEQQTELSGGGAIAPLEKTPVTAIQEALQSQPLARYELLDKAAERGWQLPTSEIAELLGTKSVSGHEFERYGFRFIRAGKAGAESTWKVEKLS